MKDQRWSAESAALAGLKRCAKRLGYNWDFFKYAYGGDFEDMIQNGYSRYLRYCIEELKVTPPDVLCLTPVRARDN